MIFDSIKIFSCGLVSPIPGVCFYRPFYFFILAMIIPGSFVFSQSAPIEWTASSQKTGNNSFSISVKGNITKGWYIYARSDSSIQLDGIELKWESQNITKKGSILLSGTIKNIRDKIFGNKSEAIFTSDFTMDQEVIVKGIIPGSIKVKIQGFAANGKEFLPIEDIKEIKLEGGEAPIRGLAEGIILPTVDLNKPKAYCSSSQNEVQSRSLISIFLLGLAGGLIALLTPCVFPMIPVTVSFFTNRARTKKEGFTNSMIYGGSILVIYLLASLPFHLIGHISPEILNSISTNVWVNLAFFVIFIIFALSFFGLFEITVPSGIINTADSKSGLGSLSGIFFMALTLAVVSFSCTGPILGSLLVGSVSSSGGVWQLTAGLAGFGLALGLPFGLFALFPEWLRKLPKSGGWLDVVKKILAFVELALAFKFLSNADLVQHWGILKREVFIAIWILISLSLFIYLLLARQRFLAILTLLFSIYLLPGLSNSRFANLKLLSGFPPPMDYSIYKRDDKFLTHIINDYAKALELSKLEHKPILIDFTGWACVNCRKMEEQVWTKPEISAIIRDKFILVSLYVDDRHRLPDTEQFLYKTKKGANKEISTAGDKWATFQAENFNQVTQPLYVILNSDQQLLNLPVGYTADPKDYKQWLECGLTADRN